MIAKISSSENLAGALGYNFKKVVSGDASVLLAEGLYANPEGGYTMEEVLSDMQAAIPKKCRTIYMSRSRALHSSAHTCFNDEGCLLKKGILPNTRTLPKGSGTKITNPRRYTVSIASGGSVS